MLYLPFPDYPAPQRFVEIANDNLLARQQFGGNHPHRDKDPHASSVLSSVGWKTFPWKRTRPRAKSLAVRRADSLLIRRTRPSFVDSTMMASMRWLGQIRRMSLLLLKENRFLLLSLLFFTGSKDWKCRRIEQDGRKAVCVSLTVEIEFSTQSFARTI